MGAMAHGSLRNAPGSRRGINIDSRDYYITIEPFGILFRKTARQFMIISLDPGRFLNRLVLDLILILPQVTAPRSIAAKVQRRWNCA